MLNMKYTHLYCGADFCCKASGHWCLVTDEQAARFYYRLKKEEEKKHNYRRFKVLYGNMASLKTKTMLTNITTWEAAARRCCLQSTKLQLNFVCSGGTL